MAILAVVIALASIAGVMALLRRVREQQDHLADLERELAGIEEHARVVTPDVARVLASTQKQLITIELLDPIGLARDRVKIAGPVGGLAPRAIERIVHEQTVKTLREVLVEYGVDAEVQLHGA